VGFSAVGVAVGGSYGRAGTVRWGVFVGAAASFCWDWCGVGLGRGVGVAGAGGVGGPALAWGRARVRSVGPTCFVGPAASVLRENDARPYQNNAGTGVTWGPDGGQRPRIRRNTS